MSSPSTSGIRGLLTAVLVAVGLSACAGYQPLYAVAPADGGAPSDPTVAQALHQVSVERIPERSGQMLREKLIERLGTRPADGPQWPLRVRLRERTQDLGIQRDASATRANFILDATITLNDPDGQIQLNRTINVITGYAILDDLFATQVAERDARERAIDAMADRIRTQLALHFARQPVPEADPETGDGAA